jgi:tRNA (guanine10-N2)-dimethyltransferase
VKEKYLLELGGENTELGKHEALELFATEKYSPKLILDKKNIIVLEVSKLIDKLVIRRLGMTKRISRIIHYEREERIDEFLKNIPEIKIENYSFAIRAIQKKEKSESNIAKKIGDKISIKNKIDLNNPELKILYYANEKSIISIWEKENKTYYNKCLEHHIKYRPYFSPISIHPRIARSMVNLSNCPLGGSIIDPFCGTGGILIEIANMEIEAIGIDILKKMAEYSNGNLKHYNLKAKIINGDIEKLKNCNFEAIVTDPPYGISTTTKGEGVKKLMERSLDLFAKKMKTKQRLVMAVSNPQLVQNKNYTTIHKFEWYIHKSLTRYILVMEKN